MTLLEINAKIAATAHQELNNPKAIEQLLELTTMEKIGQELQQGMIELVPIKELPGFIQLHLEKFSPWIIDAANLPGHSHDLSPEG